MKKRKGKKRKGKKRKKEVARAGSCPRNAP
jgi:hypothetical protein